MSHREVSSYRQYRRPICYTTASHLPSRAAERLAHLYCPFPKRGRGLYHSSPILISSPKAKFSPSLAASCIARFRDVPRDDATSSSSAAPLVRLPRCDESVMRRRRVGDLKRVDLDEEERMEAESNSSSSSLSFARPSSLLPSWPSSTAATRAGALAVALEMDGDGRSSG